LGLLFEVVLFRQFEIDILDYSEAADFFLAAFKRPEALFSSLGILGTIFFYRLVARFAQARRNKALRYALLFVSWIGLFRREILIPLAIFYFLYAYAFTAQREAERIVFDSSAVVTISTKTTGLSELRVIPIGATEKVLFGVEPTSVAEASGADRQTEVRPRVWGVPFTEIARIQYQNARFWRWRQSPNPALQGTRDEAARP
jgi:hypothetical protein